MQLSSTAVREELELLSFNKRVSNCGETARKEAEAFSGNCLIAADSHDRIVNDQVLKKSSESFSPGSGARIKASPTRNPFTPWLRMRATSSGV